MAAPPGAVKASARGRPAPPWSVDPLHRSRPALACAALLALASAFVFTRYGTSHELLHDDAIFAYGGERLLHGVPPYLSIFDHKGPLTTLLCGLGAWLGERAGADPLVAMRRLFLALGVGATLGTFALARASLGSTRAGLLAGAAFLAFARFGFHAVGGPQAKVPMVAFQAGALFCMARRRWLAAGFLGALAALAWQPMAVFPAAAVALACAASPGRRLAAGARALAGVLLALVPCAAWFAAEGALGALWEGAVVFNVRYLESPGTLRQTLLRFGEAIYLSNVGLGAPIALGLCALPLLLLARARRAGLGAALARDPAAPLFATLPWPFLWSAVDFQGHPDFFPFLPFAAVGIGWGLDLALDALARECALGARARGALAALCAAVLAAGGAFVGIYHRAGGLAEQRAEVARVLAAAPPGARWVAIGAPQVLVLGGIENPTRYGFLMRGIDNLIEATHPGGFAGWLEGLGEPDGVVVGEVAVRSISPAHRAALEAWLARFEAAPALSGRWRVCLRRAAQPGS